MSLDARYILHYDVQPYISPTPMERDMFWLKNSHGGDFISMDCGYTMFWEKPKYTLTDEEIGMLMADQVFERLDSDCWRSKK